MKPSANVIITGVGGQGNVLAAKLLASVALARGLEVSVGDVYGLSQRGGSVASHIRWSSEGAMPPLVPEGSLDLLLAFEPLEALRVLTRYGNKTTQILVNDQPIAPVGVQAGRFTYPDMNQIVDLMQKMSKRIWWVSGTRIAKDLGNIQLLNTVMLGALCATGQVAFPSELFEQVIGNIVSPRYFSQNIDAFRQGTSALTKKNKPSDPYQETV